MVDENATRRSARRAFVEHGASFDAISATYRVDRKTLAGWQAEAAQHGDDWSDARRLFLRAKASKPDSDLSHLFRLGRPG